MYYLCELFFIVIFIFIVINHLTLNRLICFWDTFVKNSAFRVLLSFWLILCQFQPGVAYKRIAYKRRVYHNRW